MHGEIACPESSYDDLWSDFNESFVRNCVAVTVQMFGLSLRFGLSNSSSSLLGQHAESCCSAEGSHCLE